LADVLAHYTVTNTKSHQEPTGFTKVQKVQLLSDFWVKKDLTLNTIHQKPSKAVIQPLDHP